MCACKTNYIKPHNSDPRSSSRWLHQHFLGLSPTSGLKKSLYHGLQQHYLGTPANAILTLLTTSEMLPSDLVVFPRVGDNTRKKPR